MSSAPAQPAGGRRINLPGVKHMIAVASGKGGVGKSTVATNLALALRMHGHTVGLVDADIYGPSIPRMMGLSTIDPQTTALPLEKYGLKLMSMGFLVNPEQPVIWRGPMVHKAITDFLTNANIAWGKLDYMLVDLPPGTGDAQLSLSQSAPLTGAVIVTMPQQVSLSVARRGLEMFRQVRVPILGVVENMSYFVADDGKRYPLFGQGGGKELADDARVPLLGEIPIDSHVAECGDRGEPIVQKYPDSPVTKAYLTLANAVKAQVEIAAKELQAMPELEL